MRILRFMVSIFLFASVADAAERPLFLDRIKMPAGFQISLYARVPDARSLALSPSGVLYVGNRQEDKVHAVIPGKNGRPPEVIRIAEGLKMPNGVAFRNGDLYVAEVNRILRFPKIEQNLRNPPKPVVVNDSYPDDYDHGWKFIAFGPDGKLYVPVGAPCNICESKDPIYASITRMNADGTGREIFARGVRNSVGFDWHPASKELWFTDNGRDRMGDDLPPDELNKAPTAGLHFGYPYFHGAGIPDPDYSRGKKRSDYVEPAKPLGPHVAALGMRFYQGRMFPEAFREKIFIAEHGSWNRSQKIGYRIMMVGVKDGRATTYEPFATGWLGEGGVWGRPVDVLVMPDGSLLISDDFAGAVYRVTYTGR